MDDFSAELEDAQWVYRGVANVRWFTADDGPFNFGDGVSIRGRSFEELAELGFGEYVLRALSDDWRGLGACSYVMVVESRTDKSPDNLTLSALGTEWTKAQRVLGALRLLAPGDISIGRMWMTRPARFDVGLGGVTSIGFSIPTMGSEYRLTESIANGVPKVYGDLRHLENMVTAERREISTSLFAPSWLPMTDGLQVAIPMCLTRSPRSKRCSARASR